jgi:hypothetical protein
MLTSLAPHARKLRWLRFLLVAASVVRAAHAIAMPPGLACFARYYAITPEEHEGQWLGRLADGRSLPWDDGGHKSLEVALEHPDLEDMLARAYPTGPIKPITNPDEDPGRVRVDALFAATYPEAGVHPALLFGRRLRVHDRALPAFRRVETELGALIAEQPALASWLKNLSGTFNPRNIAGTNRRSSHAYGISIDLDASRTQYWRWQKPGAERSWQNSVPEAIVHVFERNGFIWGGRWYHYDTMHFEYRPELVDPDCVPTR